MKIRTGFVSNSSSASFVIVKEGLTSSQEDIVHNYEPILQAILGKEYDNGWNMFEQEDCFRFSTYMDNLNLQSRLIDLGIPSGNMSEEEEDW